MQAAAGSLTAHPLPQFRRERWAPIDVGTFRVPQDWPGRTLIRFGAVDWRATVYLDGERLGAHEGGYTHFTLDAGELEPGSEHELVVEAFDPDDDAFGQPKGKQRGSHDIWYTRTYGPWRPIWIEAAPADWIRDVTLDVELRLEATTAKPSSPGRRRALRGQRRARGRRA
jgi:beta-galactosidase/beta-glucuronidase